MQLIRLEREKKIRKPRKLAKPTVSVPKPSKKKAKNKAKNKAKKKAKKKINIKALKKARKRIKRRRINQGRIRRRRGKSSSKRVRKVYRKVLQQVGLKAIIAPIYDSAAARHANLVQKLFNENLQDASNQTLAERRSLGVKPW